MAMSLPQTYTHNLSWKIDGTKSAWKKEERNSQRSKEMKFMLKITCKHECVAFRIYRCASLIDTIENVHTNQVNEMHMKRTRTFRYWMSFSVRTIESFKNNTNFLCARDAQKGFVLNWTLYDIERFCDSREGGLYASRNSSDVRSEENAIAHRANKTAAINGSVLFHRHKMKYYARMICACKSWPKKSTTISHSWLRVCSFFAFRVFICALSRKQCRLKPHWSVKNALNFRCHCHSVWDHWAWMLRIRLQFCTSAW